MRLSFCLSLTVLSAVSCTKVGPDYKPPETPMPDGAPMPDEWHQAAVDGLEEGEATLQTWWKVFDDRELNELIAIAQKSNLDLRQAVARVLESRAILGVATGDRMPVVDTLGQVTFQELSEAVIPVVPEGGTDPTYLIQLGLDANWEIDVFGRLARNIEAAAASYEASIEDYRDVMVSLLAEVALGYIEVRTLQKRIAFAEANVQAQRQTLQLTRDRFAAGLTSALDVAQAESNLGDTEASIPQLHQRLTVSLNRLAVLFAVAPGSLDDRLAVKAPIPRTPAGIAVGIPADLLRQRADVRTAERILASQTARIGVATADLYPSFSLSGFLSFDFGNVGADSAIGWALIPGFRWNLFDRERIRNRIRVEEARTEQAFFAYEQTVLGALEDVENSMSGYVNEENRRDRLVEAVDATRRSVDLVTTQYLSGLTNFQNVLDAQRSLFRLQDQLAESQGFLVQSLVQLYRSLGGGWEYESLPDLSALEKREGGMEN